MNVRQYPCIKILTVSLAFLLNHSSEYALAIMASFLEYILELYTFPQLKSWFCTFRLIGTLSMISLYLNTII